MPSLPRLAALSLAALLAAAAPGAVAQTPSSRPADAPVTLDSPFSLAPAAAVDTALVTTEVTAALRTQEAAWNAGDLRGFMDVYLRTRAMTFLSGGSVRQGWQDAYYAYVRAYPDRASMGTLTFSDLTVTPLAPTTAIAWGRWRLARADDAPGGLFTLILEKRRGTWRIIHDHTSSE